jgi:hypothetical protein
MGSPAIYGYVLAAAAAGVAAMRMHAVAMARDQQADSLDAWAAFNGHEPTPAPVVGRTPLLRLDGVRGHMHAVPVGPRGGAIYRYGYTAASGGDSTPVELTVVQALFAAGFPRLRVEPRHGAPAGITAHGLREVDLESAEFAARFRLTVDADADPQLVLALFEPDLIVWWAEHAAGILIEYELGTLVVAGADAARWADFEALVEVAEHVGNRLVAAGLSALRR